ncbi:MAG: hypothetical protein HY542_06325 [Deltaproteobacteria bacterium]|nr:hypothetical protein [Deltaproteobacteria bacterium]
MNHGKRQKAAGVWFDVAKYVFVAVVVSGLFVRPINWTVVSTGIFMGLFAYGLGLTIEPRDKEIV